MKEAKLNFLSLVSLPAFFLHKNKRVYVDVIKSKKEFDSRESFLNFHSDPSDPLEHIVENQITRTIFSVSEYQMHAL